MDFVKAPGAPGPSKGGVGCLDFVEAVLVFAKNVAINQVVMTVNGWQVTRQTIKTKSPNKIYEAQRD